MEFVNKGVYLDDDMPSIQTFRNIAMSTRVSPQIDVSPAFRYIDEINSGWIGWFSRPISGTEIEVLTSLDDGESWDKVVNGQYIQNAKQLNDNPFIKLKYVIRSYISQIREEDTPKLFVVSLTLSDKEQNFWTATSESKLTFNKDDNIQLEMNDFETLDLGGD